MAIYSPVHECMVYLCVIESSFHAKLINVTGFDSVTNPDTQHHASRHTIDGAIDTEGSLLLATAVAKSKSIERHRAS